MVLAGLLIGLLVWSLPSWAQGESQSDRATLTVTGSGHLALAPDAAFVSFGVETAGKALGETQRQNQAAMTRVIERLRELQIEQDRIQTASFTVSPQYKPPPKRLSDAPPAPPEIIGYVVSNSVTVEVRQIDKVGPVIDGALAAGANQFQGLRWALRDEQQAKLAALKQAAVKAREKAGALSDQLQVKLVRLINVNEDSHLVRPTPRVARAMMAADGGADTPILAGEVTVEATVTLVYEIGRD